MKVLKASITALPSSILNAPCVIHGWPDFNEDSDSYEDVKSCSIVAFAKYRIKNNVM